MPRTKVNENGLTQKEEIFCLKYFSCGKEVEAYRHAYTCPPSQTPSWIYKEACKLLAKPAVQARIKGLRAKSETAALYDNEQCMAELYEAYLLAKSQGDPKAMATCAIGRAKVSGLIVEKSVKEIRTMKDVKDDDLDRELSDTEAQIAETRAARAAERKAPARAGSAGSGGSPGESKVIH